MNEGVQTAISCWGWERTCSGEPGQQLEASREASGEGRQPRHEAATGRAGVTSSHHTFCCVLLAYKDLGV